MSYEKIDTDVYHCTCNRCGHAWRAFALPATCAYCKSRGWNTDAPQGFVRKGHVGPGARGGRKRRTA